jgi:hypothetical protein
VATRRRHVEEDRPRSCLEQLDELRALDGLALEQDLGHIVELGAMFLEYSCAAV